MARRGPGSDISVDRYDDRRSHVSRGPRPSRGYDDRYRDEEPEYRREPPKRERHVRERDVLEREEIRERDRARVPPQYLDEDYGRNSSAGPLVLRARETEEFDFAPRPRRRSPSPEPEKNIEKEEIIIRREESEHRPPPRPRERSSEREEIIIRKTESSRDRGPSRRDDRRDDDVVSRRGGRGGDIEREEIIIRKDERDSDSYAPRSRYDDYAVAPRPVSHERERSRTRHHGSDDGQEIIIRREEREGRNGDREKQEIIIRKTSPSRSPSPSSYSSRRGHHAPEPSPIRAPPIHQDVITHHRHIDHGYETALVSRPISRPPSPPMPPPPRESEDRIEIHRSGERNGRAYDEDIVIDRNEGPTGGRSRSPLPPPGRDSYSPAGRDPYSPNSRDPYRDYPPGRPYQPGPPAGALVPHRPYNRDVDDEAAYYDDIARRRGYPGEAYHGATRDWAIVDVPPGTERVRMDGIGGGEQEVTWQKYNGVRRSNFFPNGGPDAGYGKEVGRPLPPPGAGGEIGGRYGRPRDPKEGLWTEITRDLVVEEAIREMGYEYEETDDFYYIMQYLQYEDVARIVGLSEDIRKDRRRRAKEMGWENRFEPPRRPLPIEGPPHQHDHHDYHQDHRHDNRHDHHHDQGWDREDERYIEREIVYRGPRDPPSRPGFRPGGRPDDRPPPFGPGYRPESDDRPPPFRPGYRPELDDRPYRPDDRRGYRPDDRSGYRPDYRAGGSRY